jgi:F-type H+-transporting ATPase subunit b
MLIDWFTVIAQTANFLILVLLLKRFLYTPILGALDAREKRIADELADADAQKAGVQHERSELRRKLDEFDAQRIALLNQATSEAATERQQLLDAARTESESLRARQQKMLTAEYQKLTTEIADKTRMQVFAIARKTLTDLAGASLEARMAEVFIRRLHEFDADVKFSHAPALIRSAFELSPELAATVEAATREIFPATAQVRFEVVPDIVSGIELIMQGHKIAWSIADHLTMLEQNVNALMKTE